MIILQSLVVVFHILVLSQIIPYSIVWAGKLKNADEMRVFETVSIIINLFIIYVFLSKASYIKTFLNEKTINILIWILGVLFSLNTIGNLFSETNFELYFFGSLTFLSAFLCFKIALSK
jgi:hypothetical protein